MDKNTEMQQIDGKALTGESTTEKRFSPLWRQILGSSSPLLCTVAVGNVFGYSTILLPQLKDANSSIEINSSEESWIASIASIAMAIGCILAGIIMERFGRKPLFVIMNVLFVIGWMILCFSATVYALLLGRFVTGFCVGLLSPCVSVYISEITQPTYRGMFLSMQGLTISVGIFMPHAMGVILKWKIVAAICALIPFTCYILIAIVPESPSWLLDNGQMEKAVNSYNWFRGYAPETMNEFDKLVEGQKLSKEQRNPVGFKNIPSMLRTRAFSIPFSILLLFFATLQFAGPNVVIFYTVTILRNSLGERINEYTATMIVDLSRLAASVLSCVVIKRVGRRPLVTFSGLSTAATLFALSIYLHYSSSCESLKDFYWIPLTLFMLYVMCIMVGLNPLVWILIGELFPLRYRGTGSGLVTFFNYVFLFTSVKMSPGLFLVLGEHGVFFLFGVFCLIGTVLLTVYLPETRNKTLQEIEESYESRVEKLKSVQVQKPC